MRGLEYFLSTAFSNLHQKAMNKHLYLIALSLLLTSFFLSCGSAQKVTHSWSNPEFVRDSSASKIFVAALVANPHVRTHLEEEMGIAAAMNGFNAERSWDYFPPVFRSSKPLPKDSMIGKIKELKCDLIFTITLIEKQSETRWVPGVNAGIYGPYAGYGMRFRGFYYYWYPFIYDPGYYVTDKTYFMEGDLFDVRTEALIWSVQTETMNPGSVEDFSKGLVDLMLKKAKEDLSRRNP